MATYYIDNVGGNDANSGLSTALAKASITAFSASGSGLVAGDIIRVKNTGVDYTLAAHGGTGIKFLFSTTGTSAFYNILLTRYTTDTANPTIYAPRDPVNANAYWAVCAKKCLNIDIKIDHLLLTSNGSSIRFNTQNSVNINLIKSKITLMRSGTQTINQINIDSDSIGMIAQECIFDYNNIPFTQYLINGLKSKMMYNQFINMDCRNSGTTQMLGTFPSLYQNNIFHFKIAGGISTNRVFIPPTGSNNDVVLVDANTFIIDSATTTGNINFVGFASATFYNSLYYEQFKNNLFVDLRATKNSALYYNTASATCPEYAVAPCGNNAYFTSAFMTNITNSSAGMEIFQTSVDLGGNPFLSADPTNANFAKIDTSSAAGILAAESNYFSANTALGAIGASTGGGATPNSYDLRAGVTVGAVTGTLVIPSVDDVRSGVNYDVAPNAKIGTLESTDPGESNVKTGITYKIESVSKTGTFDHTTLYSDPGVANVLDGVNYKFNSLTNNRLGTAEFTDIAPSNVIEGSAYVYNSSLRIGILRVPAATDVKLGIGFGPTNALVYGELESTDPGIANVVSGITYKINNVDKTGTRTSIYALLAANKVELGTDRGDGSFGTNVGAAFNTALTASQIKVGEVINNLNTSITGTFDNASNFTDIDPALVVDGTAYKYNSATNNRLGTRTSIYPLLALNTVKIGIDRGDTQIGTYDGSERYTDLPENEVKLGTAYIYNNISRTGSLSGGAADYPLENKVLFPTSYAFGTKTGTLGSYNNSNLDIVSQMQTNGLSIISNVLGSTFQTLKYLKEIEKNDFYSNTKQYGIRPLANIQTNEIIGKDSLEQEYEIILTTDFDNRDGDDAERAGELYLLQKMEEIRRQLRTSKFGFSPQVRLVKDTNIDEAKKIGDNVIVLRATIKVGYSV